MTKSLEKELDYLIALRNNLWTACLGCFGGSLSFTFLNIPIFPKTIFIIIGFMLFALFLNGYLTKDDKIRAILKALRNEGG